ncbi:MAG: PAS domain S-box protein, partial [Myxococcota bacterium]|nr:PAS domain S-box protein [Myxococcota bacterium]
KRRDGSHWHQGVTESPVAGQDGRISHFVSVRRDITERVHAEQALRRNEEKLSMTLDSMGDGLIVTGASGDVVRMNPAAERFTGVVSADAMGSQLSAVLQLFDVSTGEQLMPERLDEVLAFRNSLQGRELFVRSSAGHERPVSLSATPLVGPSQEEGAIVILRDMGEQRAAMAALIESQRDFRELIARSPDGIAISAENCWVFVNPAFASALGYELAAQLIGQPVGGVVLPEDRARLEAMRKEGVDALVEVRLRRCDGSAATFEISAPREVSFEGADGLLYFARDVTARKEMESQLLLADRMVSVGTLAAGVAHEVNNPLAYVMANLDFLKERLTSMVAQSDSADARELLDALEESREGAERVRCIVRDLKHFTRGDEESLELIDVRAVVESSISVAFNEIRHRAELIRQFDEVPLIYANKARLGQLFLNLLINAAQALDEGRMTRNQIWVKTCKGPDGGAQIVVQDNGPGIDQSLRDRVFDPFFTTKPVGEGTGLGLSICHNIVTSAGGSIGFAPVDEGTSVVVTLPEAVADQVSPEAPGTLMPVAVEEHHESARILVADDEPAVARALKRALSRYDVEVVADGAAALDKWNECPFDLMFCDLMMPGLMGSDVYAALRDDGRGFHERLVFMTGGAFTAEARQFLEDVPNTTIEKPFDVPAIQDLARRMVSDLRTSAARPMNESA